MSIDIIHERLATYSLSDKLAEENAIKEICQEIALAALARAGFFRVGAFMGGTCLRILYGLNRFSEDLDFALQKNTSGFSWEPYLHAIEQEFESFGLQCAAVDRSKATQTMKKAFLKEDSFGQVLQLNYSRNRADLQRVLIKLEIDTCPPEGGELATQTLHYPYPFSITTHDFSTLFAGKCKAILTRAYVKGRDWYDFLWYVRRKTTINIPLLSAALQQHPPYSEANSPFTQKWVLAELRKKIISLDWNKAQQDVAPFLSERDRQSLKLWDKELFLSVVDQLESYLPR